LKEEALDRIKWRNRYGRGCGPVVWQVTDDDDDDMYDIFIRHIVVFSFSVPVCGQHIQHEHRALQHNISKALYQCLKWTEPATDRSSSGFHSNYLSTELNFRSSYCASWCGAQTQRHFTLILLHKKCRTS
jgi:hypothetical protein